MNLVANPITALTRQRQGILRRDDVRELCLNILNEAVAVAHADGARLAADEAEQTLNRLLQYSPELGTSMYFDMMAGRPVEIDALTGAVVALAEQHAIPTPLNRMLLVLLRAAIDATGSRDKQSF